MIKKPNLFIVGAPKCGTTSLHYYLNQHPDIFLCEPKEPNFYNTDLVRKNRILEKNYFSLFEAAATEKYVGEATPLYLMSKDAPIKIKKDCSNAKIIIAIRKPSDLLFSAYYQNKYNLIEEASTFEEAIADEENRKRNLKETITGEPVDRLIYSRFVDFYNQINIYIEVFERENVHVVVFDDLKINTEKEVRRIFDFLNISNDIEINFSIQNVSKVVKNKAVAKFIYSPPLKLRKIVRLFLPKNITNKFYRIIKAKNTDTKKENKPKIKKETEKRLITEYMPEVNKLEVLLGKDLSHWKS